MVANQDQPLVQAAEVRIAPRAFQGDPPLEHRARDVQAPGYDAVKFPSVLGADVDDDPVSCRGRERFWRVKSGDPAGSLPDQAV